MRAPPADVTDEAAERPSASLPFAQLLQLSIYWFGISAIWGGLHNVILQERMNVLVDHADVGRALGLMTTVGVAMAILVQPTVGTISDYTTSRWGRRKPYIAIGASLDVLFLVGIATGQTYAAVFAFLVLLQFSSNFAQGPFQGYVPDLVPEPQVGLASSLVGLMSVLGVIGGAMIGAVGYLLGPATVAGVGLDRWALPTIALGAIELATALGTIRWVREGRAPKERAGRSWFAIGAEAWGTDILAERSFVALLGSRLFFLMATGALTGLVTYYLTRTLGMTDADKALWVPASLVLVAFVTGIATVPSGRLSDRVGRKPLIFAACAIGAVGMVVIAAAPSIVVAEAGLALVGLASGTFLAVDWALMTDIIPKASSGRYMGISNVATASSGALAVAIGGTIMDLVGGAFGDPAGPRAAYLAAVVAFAISALFLRRVVEPRPAAPRIGDPRELPATV
ncbi:MAG TPA: MFS transporter [Candidatus Limnocylindrales bacterium]|nr:MFS transporter [Candidatus Limnocylindrales bacterium]